MKKRIFTMLLALVMIVSMLPLAAYAAEKTEKECNHSASNEKPVEVIEAGTCQTPGKVKYECNAYDWYFIIPVACDEEWVKEEITVTCHTTEVEAKDATCIENGNTAGIVCSDCGQNKTRCAYCAENLADVIEATGTHTPEAIPDVAPTCSQSGTIGGTKCLICGETLTAPEVVSATGEHVYEVFLETKVEATCVQTGTDIFKCNTCDATTERETPLSTKHAWKYVRPQQDSKLDCDTAGIGVYECEHCDAVSAQNTPKLGHDPVVLDEIREISCTQSGVTKYGCKRDGCTHTWINEMNAPGHTPEDMEAVAPNCTTTGLTKGEKCSVCGEVLKEQEVVRTAEHDWLDYDRVEANCTREGHSAYQECKVCHTIQNKVVYPVKHEFNADNKCELCGARNLNCDHKKAVITITDPTCTVDGKQVMECSCGYKFEKVLTHPGHDYNENDICSVCGTAKCSHNRTRNESARSTCTEHGYENTICRDCGKVTVSKTLPLADHNYVNGTCTVCKRIGSKNTTNDFQDIFFVG